MTALARGLALLRCFRAGEVTLTNRDFAERTGLPKATISRLTHTLCALGYLSADARLGTYRLSAGVLQLGYSALSSMDINDRVEPELKALRDGPNSYITSALGEAHQLDAVYLATQTSRQEVSLVMRAGARLPLFYSAMGRSILVAMHEDEREAMLSLARAQGVGEACSEELTKALEEYDAKGFCSGYGTWREDVNGIAVPVHSLSGERVYGLNVGGPASHVSREELEEVYPALLQKAAAALTGQ